ncbi:MAG TPA: condensation domain-containing protein, partial [Gemmatimonadaceae bacterium]
MVAGAGLSEQARALLGRRARAQEDGAAASGFGHRAGSESAPLSSWQESIWFLDQMEPGRGLNNTPAWLRLKGDLDVAALEKSLEEVFRRHVILRSHVGIEDGDAVQRPMQDFGFALPLIDLSVLAPQEREARYAAIAAAEARAPFDLAAGPFARATLIRLAADEHVLLFTAHHIAFDGWSVAVFFRELGALYGAFATGQSSSLADLRFQYADFAVWQRERLLSSSIDDDVAYWLTQMAGAPSLLALPADRPRPAARSHAAGRTSTVIPLELAARLGVLGREEGATLFMTMLAAFQLLLSRLSGEHDVVVGIPIAGRTKVETEMMLGCFINMLPLRTRILDDASFRDLLSGVRRTSLGALAHQELPFDALVERLEPERSLGHTPVTQVLFNFRNAPASEAQFHGLEVALEPPRAATIISDFHIEIEPGPGGLNCIALYSAELFDAATVERWLGHFQTLLESIVASPD